eukprot:IDg1842t1
MGWLVCFVVRVCVVVVMVVVRMTVTVIVVGAGGAGMVVVVMMIVRISTAMVGRAVLFAFCFVVLRFFAKAAQRALDHATERHAKALKADCGQPGVGTMANGERSGCGSRIADSSEIPLSLRQQYIYIQSKFPNAWSMRAAVPGNWVGGRDTHRVGNVRAQACSDNSCHEVPMAVRVVTQVEELRPQLHAAPLQYGSTHWRT